MGLCVCGCVGVWLGLGVMLTDLWYFDMEFNLISRMCVCVCVCSFG
jgi:hypothetical protein